MGAAWLIARKDLLLRLRDRSAIIIAVVVPLALAFVFNLVFGGAFDSELDVTLAVADEDGGAVADGLWELLSHLEDQGLIDVLVAEDSDEVWHLVGQDEAAAGLSIPAGMSAAAMAGRPAELIVIGGVNSPTSMAVATAVADAFAESVADSQRAVAAVVASGATADPARLAAVAEAAATAVPAATVVGIEAANQILDPSTFFAVSMAVFFVFFTVQFGVTGLLDEEREGTLTRLRAAPIARWSVVVGKALTSVVLGVLSLTVLWAGTSLLMGAEWGDPVGVVILIVAVVLAATSILGVVAAVTRTPEGAGNISAIIAVALGMLGGTFFPVGGGNRVLELLSQATPHSWFLRGMGALRSDTGLEAILPAVGGLLAFGLGVGMVAAVLLRRRYI